jgi:hypothetical protein
VSIAHKVFVRLESVSAAQFNHKPSIYIRVQRKDIIIFVMVFGRYGARSSGSIFYDLGSAYLTAFSSITAEILGLNGFSPEPPLPQKVRILLRSTFISYLFTFSKCKKHTLQEVLPGNGCKIT